MASRALKITLLLLALGSLHTFDQLREQTGFWPVFAHTDREMIPSEIRPLIKVPKPAGLDLSFGEKRSLVMIRKELAAHVEAGQSLLFALSACLATFGVTVLFGYGFWWPA